MKCNECTFLYLDAVFLFLVSRTATKFDKVVKREVCRITTQGTRTLNFLDGDCSEAQSSYLLAIAEKVNTGITASKTRQILHLN